MIDRVSSWTYRPALPKWEGRLLCDVLAFPPWERRERGGCEEFFSVELKTEAIFTPLDCNCLFFDHLLPEGRHFLGSDFTGGKSLCLNRFEYSCRGNAK